MGEFTRGPWIWEEHELSEGYSCIVYDANGYRVGTDHLDRATAALIAAAPDLYEALDDLLLVMPWHDADGKIRPEFQRAYDALEKARGNGSPQALSTLSTETGEKANG